MQVSCLLCLISYSAGCTDPKQEESDAYTTTISLGPPYLLEPWPRGWVCGDPYPSKSVYIFMMTVHSKNLRYRKGPHCGSIAKYEHASNISHPARLPTLYTRVLNPCIPSTSSDIKMQLPTEITVSNLHLTAKETCYWLENSRWMYTTDIGLQINCLFSHAPKLHMQDITLASYFTYLVKTLLNLQIVRYTDCKQV